MTVTSMPSKRPARLPPARQAGRNRTTRRQPRYPPLGAGVADLEVLRRTLRTGMMGVWIGAIQKHVSGTGCRRRGALDLVGASPLQRGGAPSV